MVEKRFNYLQVEVKEVMVSGRTELNGESIQRRRSYLEELNKGTIKPFSTIHDVAAHRYPVGPPGLPTLRTSKSRWSRYHRKR